MVYHARHEMKSVRGCQVVCGTGSPKLAQKISDYLGKFLCVVRDVVEFPNEKPVYQIAQQVVPWTGTVYVIQQTASNVTSQSDGTAQS